MDSSRKRVSLAFRSLDISFPRHFVAMNMFVSCRLASMASLSCLSLLGPLRVLAQGASE